MQTVFISIILIDCLYRFVLRAVLHSVYICQSSAVNLPPSFNLQISPIEETSH